MIFAGILSCVTNDPLQATDVGLVGTKDVVVVIVFGTCDLVCGVVLERNTFLAQFAFGGRIDVVACLFGGDGCGCYLEQLSHSSFAAEVLEYVFRHWRAADIAVADEQKSNLVCFHPFLSFNCYASLRAAIDIVDCSAHGLNVSADCVHIVDRLAFNRQQAHLGEHP